VVVSCPGRVANIHLSHKLCLMCVTISHYLPGGLLVKLFEVYYTEKQIMCILLLLYLYASLTGPSSPPYAMLPGGASSLRS
jgi:hypothetical protein